MLAALDDEAFAGLERAEAPARDDRAAGGVHPENYVQAILGVRPAPGELAMIDGDTVMSSGSAEAALRAAGAVVAGVDAVMGGKAETPSPRSGRPAITRRPTFPAASACSTTSRSARAMPRRKHGIERVAILDFDVHHGQGTQAVVEPDPSLFYGSTHQYPLYPGTGQARERGIDDNVANVPLAAQQRQRRVPAGVGRAILPQLDRFAPELVIVSAGFDAHRRDPLAQLNLETEDFAWITRELWRSPSRMPKAGWSPRSRAATTSMRWPTQRGACARADAGVKTSAQENCNERRDTARR